MLKIGQNAEKTNQPALEMRVGQGVVTDKYSITEKEKMMHLYCFSVRTDFQDNNMIDEVVFYLFLNKRITANKLKRNVK